MARLTPAQAAQVGRIRDALRRLGYVVPAGEPGTPGTLADLASMAPTMGRFAAKMGKGFVEMMRAETDPTRRGALFVKAAEAAVARHGRGVPLADVLTALGQGFVAFHAAKSPADKLTSVVGVLHNLTAATSR